ncbi:MAG: HDIG domain-containing protein [Patescibacteria group bacterium]|nr:HDIG domain-containing protein [Patescibacteria group bacterium]
MQEKIPEGVYKIVKVLQDAGFKAFIVGGSVRDLFLNREPQDWDVATDAKPEEVLKLFPDAIYENMFGTVGVKVPASEIMENASEGRTEIVEVTTFRKEGKYSDQRHPDEVVFTKSIEEDLARRDFTVNAMALGIDGGRQEIVDPFDGQADLKKKLIRAVGEPDKRFKEDALRLMRAVRFACQLGFEIGSETAEAIKNNSRLLEVIAKERVRDELVKIIMSDRAKLGMEELEKFGLLQSVIPELREGIGVGQNKHHIYAVWEHNLRALDYAVGKRYSLEVRLASLLHDVGKPRTKRGEGPDSTFYGHEVVGARMTRKILEKLHFSNEVVERVYDLVRYHLFYYNVGEVTAAGVRRFIQRVGIENIDDLLKVREADRIGSGVPKAVPYKLRHLQFMIEKVRTDPISPKMLNLNGNELMDILKIHPSPRVGYILSALLEEVLDDPSKNTKEYLEDRAGKLNDLSDEELKKIASAAKEKKTEFESGIEEEMKKKFYV